ncbi:MAG: major capsid protein [Campylobacterota bacterium]|nr:major capsid protein [Campylobacterota bacterium]
MANIDIFKNDAFSTTSLTGLVNRKEHLPTMLRGMNLFEVEPVRTTTIWVEMKEGKLALIPTSERGAPIFQSDKQKRNAVALSTLRLAKGDVVTAAELQDIRAEGEEAELKEVQSEVNGRLIKIGEDMDLTMENLMLGAIQGQLIDADGSTVIEDFYTKFAVSQPTEIDFDLDNATPVNGALVKKCKQVVRGMTKAGQGAFLPNTEIIGLAGDNFYDDLVAHQEVSGNSNDWQKAQALAAEFGAYGAIRFGGITFINYRGTDDGSTVAIGADKCKFFPKNARGVFKLALAPGESFEYVNTKGQERYAMTIPDRDRNEFVAVELKSYPLPYCTRPEMLFSAKRT